MSTRERLAVQRQLLADLAAVTDRVVGIVLREIPAYEGLSEAQRDEIGAITGWALQRTVEMWVDESPMTEADLRRFRGIGAARAADGRPLAAILRAYRVAAVETGDLVVALGAGALDVDDLAALNRTMLTGVDALSEALFTGYTHTAARLESAADREGVLAAFAADLLAGRQTSRAALADRSARLGIAVPSRFALTVVGGVDDGAVSGDSVDGGGAAGGDGFHLKHPAHDHVAHLTSAPYAVTPSTHAVLLDDLTAAQLPRAYRLATTALRRAPSRAYRRHRLLTRADALVVAVVTHTDPDAIAELPAAALGPLVSGAQRHVREGLDAYLDAGTATAAADALGVHAQTLRHRLRRVRTLTGRDPDDAWDRLVLDLARTASAVAQP